MTERNRQKPPKDAPYPDLITNQRFRECMRTPHDVGGEDDVPMQWEEKHNWPTVRMRTVESLRWAGTVFAVPYISIPLTGDKQAWCMECRGTPASTKCRPG